MTTVARPPVNEVVISISFQPQPILDGPRLLIALSQILADLPQVTEVPPYEMPAEQPPEEQAWQPAVQQIRFVSPQQMQRRYWLTASEPSPLLLQVQSNYFALNWRRQEGGEHYPGFERLMEDFRRYLSLFEQAVVGQGGERLTVSQLELTYINILRPDKLWGGIKDLPRVINLNIPGMERFESLNLAYSEPVTTESGSFYGRLHAAVATGYQPKDPKAEPAGIRSLRTADMTPVVNLSITTRSAKLAESTADIHQRFGLAHDAVTGAFKSLTTDVARRNWGLS
jgi:uncharacterized protein (TIGR04255 family)